MNPITDARLFRESIAVLIGGGIGSLCRFAFSFWVQERTQTEYFPWGIFAVNVLGCFAIGILYGLLVTRFNAGYIVRAGVFIGLLGGFTTFSSFSLDTMHLLHSGAYGVATLYVLSSVGSCIAATALGLMLYRFIL